MFEQFENPLLNFQSTFGKTYGSLHQSFARTWWLKDSKLPRNSAQRGEVVE